MRTILSSYELDAQRRSLVQELAGVDDRQLLDIGLVRAADGSLRLAEDPMQRAGFNPPLRPFKALLEGLAGLYRWVRSLPLRSSGWSPHFFLRE